MELSSKVQSILKRISDKGTKLGEVRKIASEVTINHELALELWSSEQFLARQLAILIMDKKQLSEKIINDLIEDIQEHHEKERLQLIDWFMANQLSKDKKIVALIDTWENNKSSLQRRIYWYYQARLRWTGKIYPKSEELLSKIESRIEQEEADVQWAMNFTAAQIGIFEEKYRLRCIALGERTGLYKDEMVAKNCTPNYLPKFIAIQVEKLNK